MSFKNPFTGSEKPSAPKAPEERKRPKSKIKNLAKTVGFIAGMTAASQGAYAQAPSRAVDEVTEDASAQQERRGDSRVLRASSFEEYSDLTTALRAEASTYLGEHVAPEVNIEMNGLVPVAVSNGFDRYRSVAENNWRLTALSLPSEEENRAPLLNFLNTGALPTFIESGQSHQVDGSDRPSLNLGEINLYITEGINEEREVTPSGTTLTERYQMTISAIDPNIELLAENATRSSIRNISVGVGFSEAQALDTAIRNYIKQFCRRIYSATPRTVGSVQYNEGDMARELSISHESIQTAILDLRVVDISHDAQYGTYTVFISAINGQLDLSNTAMQISEGVSAEDYQQRQLRLGNLVRQRSAQPQVSNILLDDPFHSTDIYSPEYTNRFNTGITETRSLREGLQARNPRAPIIEEPVLAQERTNMGLRLAILPQNARIETDDNEGIINLEGMNEEERTRALTVNSARDLSAERRERIAAAQRSLSVHRSRSSANATPSRAGWVRRLDQVLRGQFRF
ncbi:MAG TPA: hypothetical protein PLR08_03010 [bacterium]|nr:hypothetical protein [Candidatus Magasanikbacteria bacterium]USN52485.1 MAG: hypothetical protein H6759_00130 [Candidatus Nomurabacteria bacterium]HPF95491.1 hypothetical protein [bacterium]